MVKNWVNRKTVVKLLEGDSPARMEENKVEFLADSSENHDCHRILLITLEWDIGTSANDSQYRNTVKTEKGWSKLIPFLLRAWSVKPQILGLKRVSAVRWELISCCLHNRKGHREINQCVKWTWLVMKKGPAIPLLFSKGISMGKNAQRGPLWASCAQFSSPQSGMIQHCRREQPGWQTGQTATSPV